MKRSVTGARIVGRVPVGDAAPWGTGRRLQLGGALLLSSVDRDLDSPVGCCAGKRSRTARFLHGSFAGECNTTTTEPVVAGRRIDKYDAGGIGVILQASIARLASKRGGGGVSGSVSRDTDHRPF